MERKKRVIIVILGSALIFLAGLFGAFYLFYHGQSNPFNFIFNNFISITSFVLSFIALVIAVITYISIDSVNSATTMEGNILENENYSVEYSSLMNIIDGTTNEEVINKLKIALKKSKNNYNCIDFANHLQRTIDCLIMLRLVDVSNQSIEKECYSFMKRSVIIARRYETINSGLEYLFDENLKLIFSVLKMSTRQELLRGNDQNRGLTRIRDNLFYSMYIKNKNYNCSIQDVRGKMARNPITQIVYYDYLGVKMLGSVLQGCNSELQNWQFSVGKTIVIPDNVSKIESKKSDIILRKAEQCLCYAAEIAKSNILWNAIVQEDLFYVRILRWKIGCISTDTCFNIKKALEQVKSAWKDVEILFSIERNSYLYGDKSYLLDVFKQRQIHLEKLSKSL